MSQLEDWLRSALREESPEDLAYRPVGAQLMDRFLRQSSWISAFAWMKMLGTLGMSLVAAAVFFHVDTTRGQLVCVSIFVLGFVGFAMWWIWYWMVLNRNDTLRELKRIELQLAEMREQAGGSDSGLTGP